jgi:hypothetical protein
MVLYLIMKGCTHYMEYLKRYHQQQEYSVGDRGLYSLSELKMCKLTNYDRVPSPEEIHEIVARCITANDAYAHLFIDKLKVHERGDKQSGHCHVPARATARNLPGSFMTSSRCQLVL